MRKTKEILRQKWLWGIKHRDVSKSVGVSVGTISNIESRAKAAGLSWPKVVQMEEEELERRLYGLPSSHSSKRPLPSPEYIHQELHKIGVTLNLLHIEYLEQYPDGYKYTQFCEAYRKSLLSKTELSFTLKRPSFQRRRESLKEATWIPTSAGMTVFFNDFSLSVQAIPAFWTIVKTNGNTRRKDCTNCERGCGCRAL